MPPLNPLLRPILEPILNPILGADNAITYLLGPFRFATDEAAPMASPHTEAGAVGSLTITGAKLSASGGGLQVRGTGAWGGSGWVSVASQSRSAGRALLIDRNRSAHIDEVVAFWGSGAAANYTAIADGAALWWNSTGVFGFITSAATVTLLVTLATGTDYQFALVLSATGWKLLVKGGAFATWTLLWVANAGTTATLYPSMAALQDTAAGPSDNPRVTDLGGAWATDTGIATSYKATTTDADTATMTADALVYHTITAQTGVTQELHFRKTDVSNYWLLRMAAPGTNTIKVIEVVAGVETERASTAQTFTNAVAYRIGVIAAGAVITPYVDNTAKTGYASAATGLSATGVYVSHAGAKLECWPRTVSLPSGV